MNLSGMRLIERLSRVAPRLWRAGALLAAVVATAGLWWKYGPGPGGGPCAFIPALTCGAALRGACYLAVGGVGLLTALAPLAGLALCAFLTPLIQALPLLISQGSPYPIVLFMGAGLTIGWLVRETVQPRALTPFYGQTWLLMFALLLCISAVTSLARYHPVWQWGMPAFLSQPVNTKSIAREEAVRYVFFVLVNGYFKLYISTFKGRLG